MYGLVLFIATLINFMFWAFVLPELFFKIWSFAGIAVIPLSASALTFLLRELFDREIGKGKWMVAAAFSINLILFLVAVLFFQDVFKEIWNVKNL